MTTTAIRALTDAELNFVSGGLKDYKDCPEGTTSGGGPGMYPNYATCDTGPTMQEMIDEIVTMVRNIVYPGGK